MDPVLFQDVHAGTLLSRQVSYAVRLSYWIARNGNSGTAGGGSRSRSRSRGLDTYIASGVLI